MKRLILMQGAPGSGKSTLANIILQSCKIDKTLGPSYSAVICSSDQYMVEFSEEEGKFVYKFNSSRLKECHDNCRMDARIFMKQGVSTVIIDNTNTTQIECQPYIDKAKEEGYLIQVIRCTGNFDNIHGFSEEKVLQIKARLEDIKIE